VKADSPGRHELAALLATAYLRVLEERATPLPTPRRDAMQGADAPSASPCAEHVEVAE